MKKLNLLLIATLFSVLAFSQQTERFVLKSAGLDTISVIAYKNFGLKMYYPRTPECDSLKFTINTDYAGFLGEITTLLRR